MRALKNNLTDNYYPAPKMTLMQKLHYRIRKRQQRSQGKKISNGKLPHGRTAEKVRGDADISAITADTLLQVRHFRGNEEIENSYREVHNKVVTNAGRDAIIDAFTGEFVVADFNYHDCGTGTTTEAATQSALVTPVSETRVTGTKSQPTSDVYQTVGEFTFGNSYAVTEHGIFSQAGKPGGVLLDRSVFGAINVVSGDKISFTFSLTINSGG